MPQIPSPPSGAGDAYSCNVLGFDNVRDPGASDRMPTPKSIPTPLIDSHVDHSNTTKLPVAGPVVPNLGVS